MALIRGYRVVFNTHSLDKRLGFLNVGTLHPDLDVVRTFLTVTVYTLYLYLFRGIATKGEMVMKLPIR